MNDISKNPELAEIAYGQFLNQLTPQEAQRVFAPLAEAYGQGLTGDELNAELQNAASSLASIVHQGDGGALEMAHDIAGSHAFRDRLFDYMEIDGEYEDPEMDRVLDQFKATTFANAINGAPAEVELAADENEPERILPPGYN